MGSRESPLNRDQACGAIVLAISLMVALLYLLSLFPSYFALPTWLTWWAIALPVILAVLALLTICMWIGWVMLTTPPPPPLEEASSQQVEPKTKESLGKA